MKKQTIKIACYILIVLCAFLIIALIRNITLLLDNHTGSLIIFDNSQVKLVFKYNDQIKHINTQKSILFGIEDIIKNYGYFVDNTKQADITIVERKFLNNDVFIFYSIKKKSIFFNTKLLLSINANDNIIVNKLDKYEKVKGYSAIVGNDRTSLPMIYAELDDNSLLVSKVYKSKILSKKYNNSGESVVRHLIGEENLKTDFQGNRIIDAYINLDSNVIEGWFLISSSKLFDTQEEINNYAELLNTSGNVSPWLTYKGQYTKIPYSIEPYTKEGYARNPGANHGKEELDLYELTKENIYYDLMWNKVIGLYNMPRDESGVWLTEYTSTYISKPYGVYAPFVDTRHNENIAQFLNMIGNKYNIGELKEVSLYYPEYIVSEIKKGNIVSLKKGLFLIPDYFKNNSSEQTHASINHQLGTANVLLQAYIKTNKKDYYNSGMSILNGIAYLENKWIRENGDLWYRMNPDLTFEGTDYKTLTLSDLLIIQETLESINEKRINIFDRYIKSKLDYLVNINYNIEKETIIRLKNQGFIK